MRDVAKAECGRIRHRFLEQQPGIDENVLPARLCERRGERRIEERRSVGERRRGWLLLCAAGALYPLLAVATGHPWVQAEVFGFMPDPTALGTIGAVLATWSKAVTRALLVTISVLTLLLGMATRYLLA